jgi:starch synthase (maltosyl-transferring)
MIDRFPITDVEPRIYFGGEWIDAKAYTGEELPIRATVVREGHSEIGVYTFIYDAKGKLFSTHAMREIWPGTDRYEAWVTFPTTGRWGFSIYAFDDEFGTWLHDAAIKIEAGIDTELMISMGIDIFTRYLEGSDFTRGEKKLLTDLINTLQDKVMSPQDRFAESSRSEVLNLFKEKPFAPIWCESEKSFITVERKESGNAAWYEFFPRSEGAYVDSSGEVVSGTFQTAIKSLQRVKDMGFDVLYLPPIHPIGYTHRKGKNNTLTPKPSDPGVPWAIGNHNGGHDSINPELGTLSDFKKFVKEANKLGIEIAMDFALQVSPDHPWVDQHPQWFTQRPDGSIAYAENPPKKYQDIYPINFDKDFNGLVNEVEKVLNQWIDYGVKIFRVDNPHTKAVSFWQELFSRVNKKHPEIVFLSEAFTRPAMMHALAKAGFQQSYTYFTWRNSKNELTEYAQEVAHQTSSFFRPNFWVNTPDILPFHLQSGKPEIFKIRALLASTLTPSWGMYAGYELCEHIPLAPGREEYLDSEKYEIKVRDYESARKNKTSLEPFIAQLNAIRKQESALGQLRTLAFHPTDHDEVIAYSKRSGDEVVLVVVNLSPDHAISTYVHWNLFYLQAAQQFKVRNLLTGENYEWNEHQHITINPHENVGIIGKVIS